MSELIVMVEEDTGKSSYEMRTFFQRLVDANELRAYEIEVNKRIVEKDDAHEQVVRVKKGITLSPITKIPEYRQVMLEDPSSGVRYTLSMGSRGGFFCNDGDSQTTYDHCVLEKLAKGFDLTTAQHSKSSMTVPVESVTGRVRVSFDVDWEAASDHDYISGTRGRLVVAGEEDPLFKRVCNFVRGNNGE